MKSAVDFSKTNIIQNQKKKLPCELKSVNIIAKLSLKLKFMSISKKKNNMIFTKI